MNTLTSSAKIISLSLLITISISDAVIAGDWQDEFPITQDPVLQFRAYLTTAPDDTAYAMWLDWTDFEDTQVSLVKSVDHGQTWTPPTVIFDGFAFDNGAMLADASGLHVLLVDYTEEGEDETSLLYHAKSIDGGSTFSKRTLVSKYQNIAQIKFITGPGKLYIYAFNIVYGGPFDIYDHYLYVSDDAGDTWQEKYITTGSQFANPNFTIQDGVIHLVYGGAFAQNPAINYIRSQDDGDNWSSPVPVSVTIGPHAQLPQIIVDGSTIHVAWEDDRDNYFNIFYTKSIDGGKTFIDEQQINDTFYGARAKLLLQDDGLHILWCQYHGDNGWPDTWGSFNYGIIWHKLSTDSGDTWTEEFRVSQNEHIPPIDLPSMGANVVQLAKYSDGYCAMWQDKRDGNYDLYMRNRIEPGSPCPWDLDGSGSVGTGDLLELFTQWGTAGSADFDGSGSVGTSDLLILFANWGPCP